jgi:hypothetical protein
MAYAAMLKKYEPAFSAMTRLLAAGESHQRNFLVVYGRA